MLFRWYSPTTAACTFSTTADNTWVAESGSSCTKTASCSEWNIRSQSWCGEPFLWTALVDCTLSKGQCSRTNTRRCWKRDFCVRFVNVSVLGLERSYFSKTVRRAIPPRKWKNSSRRRDATVGLAWEQRWHESHREHLEDAKGQNEWRNSLHKQAPTHREASGCLVPWLTVEGERQNDDPADAGASRCSRQSERWMDTILIWLEDWHFWHFKWQTVLFLSAKFQTVKQSFNCTTKSMYFTFFIPKYTKFKFVTSNP